MSIGMRKILDKFFLPCFYAFCIIGVIIAVNFFINVKQQQKDALLAYEKNLNIHSANETLQLESTENFSSEDLLYSSSDESVIKVDSTGKLMSVGEGSAVLTVTTKDQKQTQALVVNVGPEAIKKYIEKNPKDNKETADTKPVDKSLPETSDNEDNSNKENNATKPNTVQATGITINKNVLTINLNSNKKTATLTAKVLPENATDKTVVWTSSNKEVATINNGIVTAKNPGTTTITATTKDGTQKATVTITVTKRVVIIIGASQVTRMADYKTSYQSTHNTYKTNDKTLVYVNKSGSGINYQTSEGFQNAKKIIDSYSNAKNQTAFDIFFPLSGNTIKDFTCDEISASNESIKSYASNYNNVINELKKSGYQVQGYIVSMHPVKPPQATSSTVVTNQNKDACTKGYRSNWKYFQFNKAMKSIVDSNYSTNLKYESLFIKIMETNNNKQNFTYKIIYNTTDGVHWDKDTTIRYVDMMLNYSGNL